MLRLPNLLMIVVTYYLTRQLVFVPIYEHYNVSLRLDAVFFGFMTLATVLIAAAGYLSNDYFDIEADMVNKPEKMYIGNLVSPRSVFSIALLLSGISMAIAIWISIHQHSLMAVGLLLLALGVTWWYAKVLKRSFIWGNVAVACMSAGTIAMAWLIEMQGTGLPKEGVITIGNIVITISLFAFLLSLMREIVKDVEDMEGDRLIGCRSLPIVKGVRFTKAIVFVLLGVTLVLLAATQYKLSIQSRLLAAIWLFVAVDLPLVYFAFKLENARLKADFHSISSLLKWVMLGGMCSLIAGQVACG